MPASLHHTVKYNRRTPQLLPGRDLPSHAGLRVGVLENFEGHISVRYMGQAIHFQEAPPRPGLLRAVAAAFAQVSDDSQGDVAANCRLQENLTILETGDVDRLRRIRKSRARQGRKSTRRMKAIGQAVQGA